MRNIKLIALALLASIGMSVFAQTGQYSTRSISADGKTSKWTFDVVSGSSKTIPDGTDDNGIVYVNGGGSNKAQTSQYTSFNKSEIYIEVPSGSAGSIAMEVSSSSDSRWFQLYVNNTAGPDTKRLWSKLGDGTDGKKGPQTFTFVSTDITTKDSKTYLYLKTNGTEMKVRSFTITLTTGSYTAAAGPSTDATLKSLTYNGTSVTGFSADKTNYDVELAAGTSQVPTVAAEANDSKATAVVTQATQLPGTAKVNVTAEDGTTKKEYTITFTVASAAPKVTGATWANILGEAVIDQVNGTITGQVINGASLSLIPQFTGNNIQSWTPQGAQDFSQGPVTYFFTSPTSEASSYTVTITEAPPMSSDATLKSLTYGGTAVPGFSATTFGYAVELASGTTTAPTVAAVANDSKATVTVTQATSVPGSAKVEVVAEDGVTKLTYTIDFTVAIPVSGLTTHEPEIYEAQDIAGGYGGKLSIYNSREYEVYYPSFDSESNLSITVKPVQKSSGVTTSVSETKYKATDGWFEAEAQDGKSNYSFSNIDEFGAGDAALHKMRSNNTFEWKINGYDQFSFYGKDNNTDASKGRHFELYVDGIKQPMTLSSSATIRRFNITSGTHVIKLVAIGDQKCEFYGFSLRLGQEPRTKWLKGDDADQVVMQTASIKPVTYVTKYNNIPGASTKLVWEGPEASGIGLSKIEGQLSDTLVLSGIASCATGEYKYAVVAMYNGVEKNRVTGKFTVASEIKATSATNIDAYQNEAIDDITFRYYALSENNITVTWKDNKAPEGITYGGSNGTYIISGTPTTTGEFIYTISVEGGNSITDTITVEVLDLGNDPVMFLYKNDRAFEQDGIYQYLKSTAGGKRNLIARKTKKEGVRPGDQFAVYKWILISEDVDADNEEILAILRGEANLPVLNMKSFAYAPGRMEWGEPNNGSLSENGKAITVQRADHPIFQAMGKKYGDKIVVLDSIARKGLMPALVRYDSTLCLATALTRAKDDYYGDGVEETFLHEIPAKLRGGNKYICMPIAYSSTNELSADGKKLLDETIKYLLGSKPTVEVPTLEITSFKMGTHNGVIDQENNQITLKVDKDEQIDLTQVQPVITLSSSLSHVTPASGETVDLSDDHYGLDFVVSDYIHRRVYNVLVTVDRHEDIENVYITGEWVNIYDIQGRKITTTNENIYEMSLPTGVYIISTANGTFKITR